MPRKKSPPLSDEQKAAKRAAKAASERERYNLARSAGFTPDQARSIKRTVAQQPDIIQAASDIGMQLMDRMGKLGEFFSGRTSEQKPTYKRKPAPKKKPRRTSDEKKKRDAAFKRLAKKNPDLSSRELEKLFREKGKSISHAKAQELIRKTKGQEKNVSKHVRFNYLTPEEVHEEFRKMYHIKKRFIYLVRFEVEVEGQPDTFEEYLHVTSDTKITNMRDIIQEVLDAWADGQKLGRKEKYKTKRILIDTITVLYAVDMNLKS